MATGRKRVVSFSSPRDTATFAEKNYYDVGGQEFVDGVVKIIQGIPRSNPNDSSWLSYYESAQKAGAGDFSAEIAEVQERIRRSTSSENARNALMSALSSNDRPALKRLLEPYPSAKPYRYRL